MLCPRQTANCVFTIGFVGLAMGALAAIAAVQQPTSTPRTISVEGRAMRVWASGLEQRRPGEPVVVLEAGAGEGLDNWSPVFSQLSERGPVVAYDRRGIGQSEPDTTTPTLHRVAQSLQALLTTLDVPPPYVLVGHSWGGLFVHAYAAQYAAEVAGLVFLDVTDFETTREEKAAVLPPADREAALAPPSLPPIPPDTPAGLRAEFAVVASEMTNDYPEARSLRRHTGVPVAVVVSTPPGRLRGNGGAMMRLQIVRQAEWALVSPNGLFVAANHVGHMVHRDDPALVVRLVEHVIRHASTTSVR